MYLYQTWVKYIEYLYLVVFKYFFEYLYLNTIEMYLTKSDLYMYVHDCYSYRSMDGNGFIVMYDNIDFVSFLFSVGIEYYRAPIFE